MEREQIRELLKKREGSKLETFGGKTTRRTDKEQDAMNLMQTWVHSLLYHKNIYPEEAFTEKDIMGLPIFIASSTTLTDYLDEFFQKLRPHLSNLNHLQILITTKQGHIIEGNTLHIDDLEEKNQMEDEDQTLGRGHSRLQKDIEVKRFLIELNKKLKQGFIRKEEEVDFRLRVGYRFENQTESSYSLVDDWVRKEEEKTKGRIKTSLKSHSLNLIYEVSH